MTTTKRRTSPPIRTDKAAEAGLQRLVEIEREKDEATAKADAKIGAIRKVLKELKDRLDKERDAIKRKLKNFASSRIESWEAGEDGKGKRRTTRYGHGVIGFKKTPETVSQRGVDEAKLLQRLKDLELVHCIREYEAPDWHALNRESDETLSLLGLRRSGGDKFVCEPKVLHTSDVG